MSTLRISTSVSPIHCSTHFSFVSAPKGVLEIAFCEVTNDPHGHWILWVLTSCLLATFNIISNSQNITSSSLFFSSPLCLLLLRLLRWLLFCWFPMLSVLLLSWVSFSSLPICYPWEMALFPLIYILSPVCSPELLAHVLVHIWTPPLLNLKGLDWNPPSSLPTNPALLIFPSQWISLLLTCCTSQNLGIHQFPWTFHHPPYLLVIKSCRLSDLSLCHYFLCPLF